MNRQQLKLSVFSRFAKDLSHLSTCKRRQVGCVIVPATFTQVLAIGYNGQPSTIDHEECKALEGSCGCLHAEMNAIAKLNTHQSNLILITTLSPCVLCAGLIINTQLIKHVYYFEEYRTLEGLTLLRKAGISVNHIQ